MGWTRDLWSICYPSLTTPTPFKSQKILFHDRAMGSNNQKEIKYVSHSNIRASVETRPPKLHNLLWFSPPPHPSIPDNLWTSPIRASRVSAVHVHRRTGRGGEGGCSPPPNSDFLGSKRKFGQSQFLKTFPCFLLLSHDEFLVIREGYHMLVFFYRWALYCNGLFPIVNWLE